MKYASYLIPTKTQVHIENLFIWQFAHANGKLESSMVTTAEFHQFAQLYCLGSKRAQPMRQLPLN